MASRFSDLRSPAGQCMLSAVILDVCVGRNNFAGWGCRGVCLKKHYALGSTNLNPPNWTYGASASPQTGHIHKRMTFFLVPLVFPWLVFRTSLFTGRELCIHAEERDWRTSWGVPSGNVGKLAGMFSLQHSSVVLILPLFGNQVLRLTGFGHRTPLAGSPGAEDRNDSTFGRGCAAAFLDDEGSFLKEKWQKSDRKRT